MRIQKQIALKDLESACFCARKTDTVHKRKRERKLASLPRLLTVVAGQVAVAATVLQQPVF